MGFSTARKLEVPKWDQLFKLDMWGLQICHSLEALTFRQHAEFRRHAETEPTGKIWASCWWAAQMQMTSLQHHNNGDHRLSSRMSKFLSHRNDIGIDKDLSALEVDSIATWHYLWLLRHQCCRSDMPLGFDCSWSQDILDDLAHRSVEGESAVRCAQSCLSAVSSLGAQHLSSAQTLRVPIMLQNHSLSWLQPFECQGPICSLSCPNM